MFKLVLIEDDIHVLRQLEKIISGIKSNFEVCKTFTHPLDAIEYIDNNEIDAVITDIKLPHMTGIELCEYCYNKHRNIKFAILSAYDYFEYAQKAIELEVTHYILKPITIAKLETTLSKLSERILKSGKSEGFADFQTTLARQKVISNLLTGFYASNDEFFSDFREYGILTDYNCCKCCVINIELRNFAAYLSRKNTYSKEEIYQIATTVTNRNTDRYFSVLYNSSDNKMCVYIFGKDSFSHESFAQLADSFGKNLCSDFRTLFDLDAVIIKTELFDNIYDFSKSRRQSITYDEQAKNIMSRVFAGEYDLAIRCIETLPLIFNNDQKTVETIYRCIAEHTADLITSPSLFPDNVEDMKKALVERIREIEYNSNGETPDKSVIGRACTFIQENFTRDITLNDVANHVFLNPIYFSSFFKKKTGEKYSDYISSLKLNRAKELLRDTDMKLHFVAEKSGFRDTNYFHKIFRAATGLTPSEYRNKYRDGKSK